MDEAGKKMTVVLVEPGTEARITEIDGGLESMQALVGGRIEVIYPFEEEVALICNEEGKITGLPFSRVVHFDSGGFDIIAGPFIVCGLTEEAFGSLTPEQAEKYMDIFFEPEIFGYDQEGGFWAVEESSPFKGFFTPLDDPGR